MITDQIEKGRTASRAPLTRSDVRTRDVINQAIASVPAFGIRRAASFLAAMKVPPEIAVRCLCDRARRRTP